MVFKMRPLTAHTGAEITGIDLRKSLDADTRDALRRAFAEHAVLAFRNQPLSPVEFLEAGRIFGEIMPQQVARFTLPDHPLVGFVSSDDTDKPGGTRLVRGEQFHTDHSNFAAPPLATSLKAVRLPTKGGDTRFVNMHAAYDDLPAQTKSRIDGLRALHVFKSSRSPRRKVELTEEERKKIPETVQPLVLVHPVNGRRAVYLNTAHIERIIGMEDEEAFTLINDLMAHCTQPKYEYRHVWQPDDMVIWDNRSLMHSATADYAPTERRYLYRLMVAGGPLQAAA
ncbi:MAG: TauD/TfdA dioxygenase family protein [Hyphomicrobiaceae bacterium]